MTTIHQKLILPPHQTCGCPVCEEGRFIKRIAALLPEAESAELQSWYNGVIDTRENQMMTNAWVQTQLEEVTETLKKATV